MWPGNVPSPALRKRKCRMFQMAHGWRQRETTEKLLTAVRHQGLCRESLDCRRENGNTSKENRGGDVMGQGRSLAMSSLRSMMFW